MCKQMDVYKCTNKRKRFHVQRPPQFMNTKVNGVPHPNTSLQAGRQINKKSTQFNYLILMLSILPKLF